MRLTQYLMKKYGIPAENVIRHYDVTGRVCPQPYVVEPTAWEHFQKCLLQDSLPDAYAQQAVEQAEHAGILKGDENGDLRLHQPVTRQDLLVILDRCGLLPE